VRALFWLLGLTLGFALATLVVGWWAVPFVALVAGFAVPLRLRPALLVPAAAGLAWLALLLRAARADGFAALTAQLDQLLPIRSVALFAATLLFPIAAAAGAALVASALREGRTRSDTRNLENPQ
jgi:hypothetical protein